MPLVEITLRKGRSSEFLRLVADAVHDALVSEANVPADDRFQIIQEVEPDRLIAHPSYGGVTRSDGLIVVKVTLNAGRTLDIKKRLYASMADRLEKTADVRRDDLLVCLVEVTKENWSFGNGLATYG
jgi:4-oxalocrotonate tautomerase